MTDELLLADVEAWRTWLETHHEQTDAVLLVLAKKGVTDPTSLTYDQALDEALCQGWIDGQVTRRDDATYRQRFSPRRARSPWSARNVGHVARLEAAGRLRPHGLAEIARAKADGRWEAAYAGSATAEPPADLLAALAGTPAAQAVWDTLNRTNRYAVIWRVVQPAARPGTRARRIATLVAMLARGETPHPQAAGHTGGEPPERRPR